MRKTLIRIGKNDTGFRYRIKRAIQAWQKERWADGMPARLEDLAHEAHYCDDNKSAISDLINGRKNIHVESLERIADVLGCRLDYLLEKDDFMTDEEYLLSGGKARTNDIEFHMEYLEHLGFKLRSRLFLYSWAFKNPDGTWQDALVDNWEDLKQTFTEDAWNMPIDLEGRTFADYDGKEHLPIDYTNGIPVRRTINDSVTAGYSRQDTSYHYAGRLEYTLEYEVYQDGRRIAWLTMEELEKLFLRLDRYATFVTGIELEQHAIPRNLAHGSTARDTIHDYK